MSGLQADFACWAWRSIPLLRPGSGDWQPQDTISAGQIKINPPAAEGKAWAVVEIKCSWPTRIDAVAMDPTTMNVTGSLVFNEFNLGAKPRPRQQPGTGVPTGTQPPAQGALATICFDHHRRCGAETMHGRLSPATAAKIPRKYLLSQVRVSGLTLWPNARVNGVPGGVLSAGEQLQAESLLGALTHHHFHRGYKNETA